MRKHLRVVALLSIALLVALPSAAATAKEMYAAALAQAQRIHDAATGGPPPTAKQYRAVVAAFEAVVRRHPTTGYADNALMEGGELAREASERFGGAREKTKAFRLWTWLIEQYPTSPLVPRAREALKRLNATTSSSPSPEARRTAPVPSIASAADATRDGEAPVTASLAPAAAGLVVLRDIRRTVLGDTVRVTIELDAEVSYRTERVENPARVLFDLPSTRTGPSVPEGTLTYGGEIVRHIRIGRHPNHVVRVVLDIEGVKRYSVFTLYGPYRIVVDCERGAGFPGLARERIAEERVHLPQPDPEPEAPKPLERRPLRVPLRAMTPAAGTPSRPLVTAAVAAPPAPLLRPTRRFAPTGTLATWQPLVQTPAAIPRPAPAQASSESRTPAALAQPQKAAVAAAVETETPAAAAASAKTAPVSDKPVTPSQPLAVPPNGFSMARQLGLGATRIVIDPGHGGHDPGAEGAGVFEAAIVLDVALRLEKLLVAAGSEVVLTRRTDQYIPLEERTAIANRAQGDLFLSIHANASRNRSARGVESYVLNFATTPDAEAVAARENASTGLTMSSLTEIVKAIALNNKLDESRNFAGMVQRQLVEHLQGTNKELRNHGVKQAPFVVLIGASMPSVLVEISFITNSQEGRLLRTGAYRQKIAEGLLDAIRAYQRSLKGTPVLVHQ